MSINLFLIVVSSFDAVEILKSFASTQLSWIVTLRLLCCTVVSPSPIETTFAAIDVTACFIGLGVSAGCVEITISRWDAHLHRGCFNGITRLSCVLSSFPDTIHPLEKQEKPDRVWLEICDRTCVQTCKITQPSFGANVL